VRSILTDMRAVAVIGCVKIDAV